MWIYGIWRNEFNFIQGSFCSQQQQPNMIARNIIHGQFLSIGYVRTEMLYIVERNMWNWWCFFLRSNINRERILSFIHSCTNWSNVSACTVFNCISTFSLYFELYPSLVSKNYIMFTLSATAICVTSCCCLQFCKCRRRCCCYGYSQNDHHQHLIGDQCNPITPLRINHRSHYTVRIQS